MRTLIALLLCCAFVIADSDDCFLRGDTNGDGSVNLGDVTSLSAYASGNYTGNLNDNLDALDANDDGNINIADPSYLSGILFNSYFWPAPNPEVGKGQDPTPDSVNDPLGDAGDYAADETVGLWNGDGASAIIPVGEADVYEWPSKDSGVVAGSAIGPEYSAMRGALFEVSSDEVMSTKRGNAFLWTQQLKGDSTKRQLNVGQILRACRHGRSSGPGFKCPYTWIWQIAMSDFQFSGVTDVYIDGDTKLTVLLEVSTIPSPTLVSVEVPLDLGDVGVRVMASQGVGYRPCPEEFENTCETAISNIKISDSGAYNGILLIDTKTLYDALVVSPTFLPHQTVTLVGYGFAGNGNAPKAYHAIGGWDATAHDEVLAIFMMGRPTVTTTTVIWD